MSVPVSLSRPGMVCSVGFSTGAVAAAFQAGISGMVELPHLDRLARPIVGGYVQELDEGLTRRERVIELLANAVVDSMNGEAPTSGTAAPELPPLERLPLLVAVSEPDRPGGWSERQGGLLAAIERRLGTRFHPKLSRVFADGHVGGARALVVARELVESGAVPGCVVAGADSLLSETTLGWLQDVRRLKTDDDSDGLLPGEAAAAVYVEPIRGVSLQHSWVVVEGIGFGTEPSPLLSDEPLLATGICAATRAALAEARCALHEVDLRLSDVTGESYGFREQALMMGRLVRQRRETLPIWHMSQSLGDCGAAAGVCQMALATHLLNSIDDEFSRVASFNSAIGGARSVVLVHKPPAVAAPVVRATGGGARR